MRKFSSAEAKNRFGERINAARLTSAAVTKYDAPFVILIDCRSLNDLRR